MVYCEPFPFFLSFFLTTRLIANFFIYMIGVLHDLIYGMATYAVLAFVENKKCDRVHLHEAMDQRV